MHTLQWKTILAVTLLSTFTCKKISASRINRNCWDIQDGGNTNSDIYTIFPYKWYPDFPVKVYCDMETDDGGWTVIQSRADIEPREDFYRTWTEYALGFGDLDGEFWLGNDIINALTDQTLNEIRIDLEDFEQNTTYAKYSFFYVHDRDSSYKLEVDGYSGDAGDSLQIHNGMKFTTKDLDNDNSLSTNCAKEWQGAWWYRACYRSNLNGLYDTSESSVNWNDWLEDYSLKAVTMKIRPRYT